MCAVVNTHQAKPFQSFKNTQKLQIQAQHKPSLLNDKYWRKQTQTNQAEKLPFLSSVQHKELQQPAQLPNHKSEFHCSSVALTPKTKRPKIDFRQTAKNPTKIEAERENPIRKLPTVYKSKRSKRHETKKSKKDGQLRRGNRKLHLDSSKWYGKEESTWI